MTRILISQFSPFAIDQGQKNCLSKFIRDVVIATIGRRDTTFCCVLVTTNTLVPQRGCVGLYVGYLNKMAGELQVTDECMAAQSLKSEIAHDFIYRGLLSGE